MSDIVPAHVQHITRHWSISYPDHSPRQGDPNYVDFEAYRKTHIATAVCSFGNEIGDMSGCAGGLQLHHSEIEFALLNAVDLKHLEYKYPGVSDQEHVGAWIESADNLVFLCQRHHVGTGSGVHDLAAADYEASKFTLGGTIRP